LLIVAGAGTGKTTVITRRIAHLIHSGRARPEEILALTFTEKAAQDMEERVDLLVPYGELGVELSTFHAFGDRLLREHALTLGLSPRVRVLSQAEQVLFLRRHLFEFPLERFRPLADPTRFVGALATLFARAKDEAVTPEEFAAYAESLMRETAGLPKEAPAALEARRMRELAGAYAGYQAALMRAGCMDFGDQILLSLSLLERHPDVTAGFRARVRYLLVDEFQDTNDAQFRLLQWLAPPTAEITVVGDDDQSIYKWRGASVSNVVKFLELYRGVRTIVLTENFRSGQAILDCAYRLIRCNDPDRLEVRQGIDKRLRAASLTHGAEPSLHVFETVAGESDWVAETIRQAVESGARRPGDYAILVRSNRQADPFLRSLNVAGIPWQFSGSGGWLVRAESKLLLSCLKALSDPDDSLSWYHVAGSSLYDCPMGDVARLLAKARRTNRSLRVVMERALAEGGVDGEPLSQEGTTRITELLGDVGRLLELSRAQSGGQLLYRWLSDRSFLKRLAMAERAEDVTALHLVARFFQHLARLEERVGGSLQELLEQLELLHAMDQEPSEQDDPWADVVQVMTIHKAKGLEFPVVFLVGLIQGRFPSPHRTDPLELPEPLIKDLLPAGDYHLQEERRLCYVGMTRAKEALHLTCAYDYGGKTTRKISRFVVEALNLASPTPKAKKTEIQDWLKRQAPRPMMQITPAAGPAGRLRLDPHGVDDYLTCPLKYRYTHLLKIPVMRHHLVVYGLALHKAIEAFFTRTLQGRPMGESELLETFEHHWSAEGFLSREHEERRQAQGRATLQRFFAQQATSPERPTLIEAKFTIELEDPDGEQPLVLSGRWDRVDVRGEDAVIIDYKSSEVSEQAAADRRTAESLQMLLYALAWFKLHGRLPHHVELRFLETGVTGRTSFTEEDLARGEDAIRSAAKGIRAQDFSATPQAFACRWCAFQAICPFAFQG
jgi:DNA helicase-2/ATP-dependent DNA helicase PcrA